MVRFCIHVSQEQPLKRLIVCLHMDIPFRDLWPRFGFIRINLDMGKVLLFGFANWRKKESLLQDAYCSLEITVIARGGPSRQAYPYAPPAGCWCARSPK
jgi:hypothetical protein